MLNKKPPQPQVNFTDGPVAESCEIGTESASTHSDNSSIVLKLSNDLKGMRQLQEIQGKEILLLKDELSSAKREILSLQDEVKRFNTLETAILEWRERFKTLQQSLTSIERTSSKEAPLKLVSLSLHQLLLSIFKRILHH